MIALSVLTVGFLGIATLLSKSFFLNRVNADEVTGTYLASEGIEIMKNMLDHDVYSGGTWGTCGGSCGSDGTYIADYTTGMGPSVQDQPLLATACAGAGYPHLNFSTSTRLYSYSSVNSVTTGFQRCIRISHTVSNGTFAEVTVDSIVTWSTGPLASQSVDLEDHFYNWHP